MKQIFYTFLFILFLVSSSWANGQKIFIKECGSCHKAGGDAPVINPADKAAIVWKKYFKRRRHPVDISSISPDDMAVILKYLQAHAADSDQPEAAIIPK